MEMIIVCKFHDPSIINSRDTEGGSEEPPQSQVDQKSPVWIGLNEHTRATRNGDANNHIAVHH